MTGVMRFFDDATTQEFEVSATHPLPVTGIAGGTFTATGNVASGATDSGSPVKVGGVINTTLPTFTNGQRGDFQLNTKGMLGIYVGDPLGTPATVTALADGAGSSFGLVTVSRLQDWNGASFDRVRKPNATSRIPSAANTTNATSAKASAGDVCFVSGFNAAASVRYLKIYDKASAPTVGTDTPKLTITLAVGANNINLARFYCGTGIAYALTTGAADADTGALTAADIVGLTLGYA